MHNLDDYKIYELLEGEFHTLPIGSIDFKRHLIPSVALHKHIITLPNGRPQKAEYYYNNDLIVEIRFTFTDNPVTGLIAYRKESIFYVAIDGSYSAEIVKDERIFDPYDLTDNGKALRESRESRETVVDNIKTFIGGVLIQAMGLNLHQVVTVTQNFWDYYRIDLDNFIQFGLENFEENLALLDLSTTDLTFLSIVIDENGTTIRDYVVAGLSNA